MATVQLYVDGCDVSFDPATADNVRANLVAVDGRTHILRPGDTMSLGSAPVLDGTGCLALRVTRGGAWAAATPPSVSDAVRRSWVPVSGSLPAARDAAAQLVAALEELTRGGLTPGQALARLLPGGGGIAEGSPADWWLVPGGPLADLRAMAQPRHVVEGGWRVGRAPDVRTAPWHGGRRAQPLALGDPSPVPSVTGLPPQAVARHSPYGGGTGWTHR